MILSHKFTARRQLGTAAGVAILTVAKLRFLSQHQTQALTALPNMSHFSDMSATSDENDAIWKALADATRRQVLDALAERPLTTGELVERFETLCRTAVMKHLEVLVSAGLVIVRREGRVRWNYLNPVPIERVCERWVSRHVRGMAGALSRLKDHVEAESSELATQATSIATHGHKTIRHAKGSKHDRS